VGEYLKLVCRIALVAALLGVAAACARPVGDFGRAQPGALHDDILPAVGKTRAQIAGEPTSRFNLTDAETEMHDRVWRFLVAPHAHDWFYDTAVELQRTRLTTASDHRFAPDRYYRWLRKTEYRSSQIRYASVADHIRSDLDTMPATFLAICAVLEVDRQRGTSSRELGGLAADQVRARRYQNDMRISWFVRAVRYRFDSYSFALDHLLVETPHSEAVKVDGRLDELSIYVGRAERGDFCSQSMMQQRREKDAIPSRVLLPTPREGAIRK
jgi:hypothetical protein